MTDPAAFLRLAKIAREERARRAKALAGTPHAGTSRAIEDDALWFHIERRALRAAGDEAALRAPPRHYAPVEIDAMTATVYATWQKARERWVATSDEIIATKMDDIRALWYWLALGNLRWVRVPS